MVGPGEKGLASSRWAPINTGRPPGFTYTGNPYEADSSALSRVPTPWSELSRFMKIARRMRWKLPFLGQGYRAATDRALNTPDDRAEAELMFKLDFFEYYMLLERALVHLMGVFGVKITGAFGGSRSGTRTANGGNGRAGAQQQHQSDHRFHANVLDALDDPRNPLHPVLGAGDARYALARAKELRNRWKNADEPDSVVASAAAAKLAAARPLEDYDLEGILEAIFAGLEGAYAIADRYVASVRALAAERGLGVPGAAGAMTPDNAAEEAQWEFMVDAMDWEAV
ncbi:putative ubiquitination network signaling protein [Diaporthe ampelina]|uniref:Putative ubiquitination network signaling protein n=1 Tax=Diaporthe ampelina TaxID=1214573 RepID=A0A0G2FUY4_9PEZI|nr:putative ubiquitination network signaling protein [Diaporthe ampelina]